MKDVTSVQPEVWTTRRLLEWIDQHLERQGVHNSSLVARMLLVRVLGGTDIDLFTDPDRPASAPELDRLRSLVTRAAAHEPVQYLVGKADFFGRSFRVDSTTLIPRSATESLVQVVLDWYRGSVAAGDGSGASPLRIVDLGTGSGCIGITLVRQVPGASVLATDVVDNALNLARANAAAQEVEDRIEFRHGSLLEPLLGDPPCDVICGNLPYVSDSTWAGLEPNVREHEPETALRGGPDGLDLVRPVIAGAADHLRPGGLLVLEIDPHQAATVLELARREPAIDSARIERDEFKDERILRATINPRVT